MWRILNDVDEAAVEEQVARHNEALDADDAAASQVRAANVTWLQGQAVDGKELRGINAHSESGSHYVRDGAPWAKIAAKYTSAAHRA